MPFQTYNEVELSYMSREEIEKYAKRLASLHKTMLYNLSHPEAKFWKRLEDMKQAREQDEESYEEHSPKKKKGAKK